MLSRLKTQSASRNCAGFPIQAIQIGRMDRTNMPDEYLLGDKARATGQGAASAAVMLSTVAKPTASMDAAVRKLGLIRPIPSLVSAMFMRRRAGIGYQRGPRSPGRWPQSQGNCI